MLKTRSTLKDVGLKAGVATSTAAAILRKDPSCFAGTGLRQRVLDAARQLRYKPDLVGRMLRTKKSHTIGLIVPNMQINVTATNMELMENLAWKKGYHLFMGYSQNNFAKEEALVSDFVERYVDGIIFIVGYDSKRRPCLERLLSEGFPLVSVNSFRNIRVPFVSTDFHHGGRIAAEHLLKLGHRKIAVISTAKKYQPVSKRVAGFQTALRTAGLKAKITFSPVRRENVISTDDVVAVGYEIAKKVLSEKDRPTAVFSYNDETGLGVLKAASELGIEVPGELSVVGFDDNSAARFASVPLTTVRQPREEISQKAMEMLLNLIEQKGVKDGRNNPEPAGRVWLKPKLIVRCSTAAPPSR